MPADIVGWAMAEKLELVAAIPPSATNGGEIAGLVAMPPERLAAMFRRDGGSPPELRVFRVRAAGTEGEWLRLQSPEGVVVHAADIMIKADEVERFEDDHGLSKRQRGGSAARWDWEAFWLQVTCRIHNHGLPETQRELVLEMVDWFSRRSDKGDAPDESTIRRKIAQLWKELRDRDLQTS